jgi:hypothetical protein
MSAVEFDGQMAEPEANRETNLEPAVPLSELQTKAATAQSSRISHTIDLRQNRTVLMLATLAISSVGVLLAGLWLGHFSASSRQSMSSRATR